MRIASAILGVLLATSPLAATVAAQVPASAPDGFALLAAGKFEQARDAFEALLTADPANGQAQSGEVKASERIALQSAAHGQANDALGALLRAKRYAPENPQIWYDLGILEEQMHLYHDADESLAKAEQLNLNDPNVLYGIARVKMDLGQLAAAQEHMQAYLKLRPEDASAHFGLGRIYQIGLQLDQAEVEFKRSIELQPRQTESYFELGDIALKRGQYDQALTQYAKTLERNPTHGGALEGSGEANFKLKHYEEAEAFLRRAINAAPGYQPSHYYLGLTLARVGKKEEAQRELSTASKMADEENKRSAGQLRLNVPQGQP